MNLCTIIAKNYVAQARILAASFRRHHRDGRCFVLIVDEVDGYVDPAAEPFELVRADEIGLDRETFLLMATIYDVMELSTAVKPSLLATLIERLGEPVLYLDPDIEIFAPLDDVHRLAGEHGLVLTPHLTEPLPSDGKSPSELQIVASGAYNLGFVALASTAGTDRLLRWWARRLRYDCLVDHPMGLFVDQRWFDLATSLADNIPILGTPAASRLLEPCDEGGRSPRRRRVPVKGAPLRFFHYSGYNPSRPQLISKHQNRISLAEDPVLRELFGRYADALRANGHAEAQTWPNHYDLDVHGERMAPCPPKSPEG